MCTLDDCNWLTQVEILKMHSRAQSKIDFDDMLLHYKVFFTAFRMQCKYFRIIHIQIYHKYSSNIYISPYRYEADLSEKVNKLQIITRRKQKSLTRIHSNIYYGIKFCRIDSLQYELLYASGRIWWLMLKTEHHLGNSWYRVSIPYPCWHILA